MKLFESIYNKNERNLDQVAIYFYEDFSCVRTLTYAQLFDEVDQRAAALEKMKASGFVMLCVVHPLEFIFSFLALTKVGCVPVPLAPVNVAPEEQFVERLKKLFLNFKFDFVISDVMNRDYFTKYQIPILNSDIVSSLNQKLQRISLNPHPEACFIQFSSGSTADPKGIVINHRQLLANLMQINSALNPSVTDKLISWLPLYHDMGLIGAVLSPLFAKAELHLMATRDYIGHVEKYIELICRKKINFILGPDFMYRQISKILMNKNFDLSHLTVCMSGAELVLPSTATSIQKALIKSGCTKEVFRPVYGMAEACLGVTFHPENTKPEIFKFSNGRAVVSCGFPLNGQHVKIVNAELLTVPDETVGEVAICGESVFSQYFMQISEPKFTMDDYYLTGDEGFIKNQQLYLLGRKKDVIIHNGVKYHSVDLESYLFENLKNNLGRMACVQTKNIFIVAEISWFNLYKSFYIKRKIVKLLSSKVPVQIQHVFLVPQFDLPRTTSGKIQRYKVIENIENEKYQSIFYFFRAILKILKNAKGMLR